MAELGFFAGWSLGDLLREVKGVLRQQADPKILQKIPRG